MFLNILFLVSALLTIASAIAVVFTRNIMHACVYLFGSLFGVAGLYATLNADFIAVAQVMVYVGGVVILMVFAVMLTGGQDFKSPYSLSFKQIPVMGNLQTYLVGIISTLVMMLVIFKAFFVSYSDAFVMKSGKGAMEFSSTVDEIGTLLMTDHVLAFEVSSILLLGALIGAAIISRARSLSIIHDQQDHQHQPHEEKESH